MLHHWVHVGAGPHPHQELSGETLDLDQPELQLFPVAPHSGGAAQVRQDVYVTQIRMFFCPFGLYGSYWG